MGGRVESNGASVRPMAAMQLRFVAWRCWRTGRRKRWKHLLGISTLQGHQHHLRAEGGVGSKV